MKYNLKIPRFEPYKNIYIGVEHMIKICTKCGTHKQLKYETFCKDSKREYGFKSQCRQCHIDYVKNRKTNNKGGTNDLFK